MGEAWGDEKPCTTVQRGRPGQSRPPQREQARRAVAPAHRPRASGWPPAAGTSVSLEKLGRLPAHRAPVTVFLFALVTEVPAWLVWLQTQPSGIRGLVCAHWRGPRRVGHPTASPTFPSCSQGCRRVTGWGSSSVGPGEAGTPVDARHPGGFTAAALPHALEHDVCPQRTPQPSATTGSQAVGGVRDPVPRCCSGTAASVHAEPTQALRPGTQTAVWRVLLGALAAHVVLGDKQRRGQPVPFSRPEVAEAIELLAACHFRASSLVGGLSPNGVGLSWRGTCLCHHSEARGWGGQCLLTASFQAAAAAG